MFPHTIRIISSITKKKQQQKICNTVVDYACDVCCSRAPNLRFGMSFFSGVGDGTNILFSFFMNDFLFVLFLAAFLVDWIGIQIQCSIVVLHIMYEIHFRPIFLCNSYYMVRCSPLFLSIFFSNAIIHYICVCYLLNHWMHELAPMPVQKASYDFSFLFHSFRPLQLLWMRALSLLAQLCHKNYSKRLSGPFSTNSIRICKLCGKFVEKVIAIKIA